MAKPLHALATATVLAGATFAAQTASADLLYSFEDGTVQGFNIRGSDATMLSIDAPGATDGMLALQVDRPSGGFDNDLRVTATQFLPQLAAADALAFDLTVLNNAGNPTFTQFGLEINAGEGFVNLPFQPVSNDPTSGPQTLQFDLSSANIDGDEDFITIFFRSQNDGSDLDFAIDNVRTVVPEPTTGMILLAGLSLLAGRRRR